MVRKLKYHEQKLLKKVDFLNVSFTYFISFLKTEKVLVETRWKFT